MRALFGYDLVGLQSRTDLQHFTQLVKEQAKEDVALKAAADNVQKAIGEAVIAWFRGQPVPTTIRFDPPKIATP